MSPWGERFGGCTSRWQVNSGSAQWGDCTSLPFPVNAGVRKIYLPVSTGSHSLRVWSGYKNIQSILNVDDSNWLGVKNIHHYQVFTISAEDHVVPGSCDTWWWVFMEGMIKVHPVGPQRPLFTANSGLAFWLKSLGNTIKAFFLKSFNFFI